MLRPAMISMIVSQAAVVIATLTLPVLAPVIGPALDLDARLVGLFASMIYLSALFSSLATPICLARWGAVRISQATLVLAAIGLGLLLAGKPGLLPVSAILLGFGYAPSNPASSQLLSRFVPPHLRARLFSLKQISVPAGGAIAAWVLPVLTPALGWQGTVGLVALLCLVIALAIQPWRAALDDDADPLAALDPRQMLAPLRVVITDPVMRRLAIASAPFAGVQFGISAVLVTFLVHNADMALADAGLILSAALAASVGARVFWGWVSDHLQPRRVLALLGAGMAAAALLLSVLSPAWPHGAILLVGIFYGVTAFSWNGVFLAEIANQAPKSMIGLVTAGVMCVLYVGSLSMPGLYSLTATLAGDRVGFVLMAIAASAAAILLLLPGGRRCEPPGHLP